MKNKKLMYFNSYDFIKGFKGNDTIIINNNKIFQFNFFYWENIKRKYL